MLLLALFYKHSTLIFESETIKYSVISFSIGGICIATYDKGMHGAIKDRYQIYNSHLELWIKYNAITGEIVGKQKTKFKNVRVR